MSNPITQTVLFRCSRLGDLMTNGRGKSDDMGETAKTLIRNLWLENEFGYREEVMSDDMLKGHLCEQDSLALTQKVLGGELRVKNDKRLANEYICGTPDLILKKQDVVEDTKTSANLRTFFEAGPTKNYEWQLQGYMWLTGKRNARLIYCLVPTPEELITEQKKRLYFRFNCDESNPDYIERCAQVNHNNQLISHIPAEKRVKVFEFRYQPELIEALKQRVELAREYYHALSL